MSQSAYIFIGAPGSGKGSLSKLCTSELGWQQLSTGNLCRQHIKEQTPIGKEIDFIIKSGKLISDELVSNMVDEWLSKVTQEATPFILDGYPRNLLQAETLLRLVQQKYPSLQIKVIRFLVSDEVAVSRICDRYVCQNSDCQAVFSANAISGLKPKNALQCDYCSGALGRRCDDERETVIGRLKIYRAFEQEMLACFSGSNIIELDTEQPLEKVFETFMVSIQDT